MTQSRARESTLAFLALVPITEIDDAIIKVDYHISQYPEFLPMRQFVLGKKDEHATAHIVARMQELMRQQDIDGALAVASDV